MLLCGSCQRKKSFECERCPNWTKKDPSVCRTCFWGQPAAHTHLATRDIRRVELSFSGADARRLDRLARRAGLSLHDYIRNMALTED